MLPLRKMEKLQMLLVGANACLYTFQPPGVYILYSVFKLRACMYFLCYFSLYKPLEFAVLSAMTMMSFVPTGVFPGKVFVLKKCHFPIEKKKKKST